MRERDIEKKLVAGIKKLGGVAYKWTSPGQDGVPDRIVILPDGEVIFVELKQEEGRLSKLQRYQIDRLRLDLKQEVRILWSATDVDHFLAELKARLEAHEV